MRGRVGGRIGTSSPPSGYGASGIWRLADVYAAKMGSYGGGGEYGMGGWPSLTFTISWPSMNYPPYSLIDYADATGAGTATFDARVSSFPTDVEFGYFWEKSTNAGSTWSTVPGSSGTSATSQYNQYGTSVTLDVTGQTLSDDGTLYRLVVNSGLKQIRGTSGTLRVETSFSMDSWTQQPSNALVNSGQTATFFARTTITGNTYGQTYNGQYQWQRSTDSGTTWSDFGDVIDPGNYYSVQLQVVGSAANNGHRYRAKAFIGSSFSYSNVAALFVA